MIWFAAEEHRLLESTGGPVGRYLATLGVKVETRAKYSCPYKSGRLKSSINTRLEDGPVAIVGTNVEYAVYVHDGTRYMKARPFLIRGLYEVVGSTGGWSAYPGSKS